jgi:hypothetical protein
LPKYEEVNWDLAECRDTYTELFYTVEEERNQVAYRHINAVRSICARCVIWDKCLTYAFQNENYGVWGGMTSLERKSFGAPHKYPAQKQRAIASLEGYGITLNQIWRCYEYSSNDRSLEDQITDNRKDDSASHSRPRK